MVSNAEDNRKLSHLLRRAAFGARPAEWAGWRHLGVEGSTARLLHPEQNPDNLSALYNDIAGEYVDLTDMESVRLWWIYRMAHTDRPLEEKMTLFWHGHFATANYKVERPAWMWRQNEVFRTHALGNFSTLLKAVSRDPAMLIWLDGEQNRKGAANENYGRELLELFTMGWGSGYTETDVGEAARSFTGWRFDHDTGDFLFNPKAHDDGVKTFLGETGNFNGDDIIDIVVRRPATAHFLVSKLFKFFVHDDPSDADLAAPISAYFSSGYDIRSVMGSLLGSPAFYSDAAYMAKIKSPAEYVVTLIRTLDAPLSVVGNEYELGETLRAMGQDLFNPPNVKGWAGGQAWINTMTLLTRMNFANRVIDRMNQRGLLPGSVREGLDGIGLSARGGAPEIAEALWQLVMPGHMPSDATRSALISYVSDGQSSAPSIDSCAPGALSLVMSSPEYQLA
jgi:uncharacterized protein (DUF1800 family)